MSKITSFSFVAITVGALLSGCGGGGGGGGGGGETPTAVITEDNATTVAGEFYESGKAVSNGANFGGSNTATGAVIEESKGIGIVEIIRYQLNKIDTYKFAIYGNAVATGASESITVPCDVGNIDLTMNDSDGNEDLSAGDSLSMTMNNCGMSIEGGTGTVSGNMRMVFSSVSADQTQFSLNLTFSNLFINAPDDQATLNGDMNMDMNVSGTGSSVHAKVNGDNLSVTLGDNSQRTISNYKMDLIMNGSSATYTFDGMLTNSATLGGTIAFKTTERFHADIGDYPYQGVMVATGAKPSDTATHDSTLTLTAIDSIHTQIDIDADGDGTAEISRNVPWSEVNL